MSRQIEKRSLWKYIFVGSGPATLAALVSLPVEDRKQSLILEAGKGDNRRICPELNSKSCSSCDGESCPVVNGLGGASAMLGNKLCQFPASSGVLDHSKVKLEPSFSVSDSVKGFFNCIIENSKQPNLSDDAFKKFYHSDRLFLDDYRALIQSLVSEVRQNTIIRTEHEVVDIKKRIDDTFLVRCANSVSFTGEKIVLSPGRGGHIRTRKLFEALEVDYSEQAEDVGFRIELPTHIVNPKYLYQVDPKLKFSFGNLGSARTFCTCMDGSIVPVKFGRSFYADGAFVRTETGKTNFAIMARTHRPLGVVSLEAWIRKQNETSLKGLLLSSRNLNDTDGSAFPQLIVDMLPDGPTEAHSLILEMATRSIFSNECSPIDFAARNVGDEIKIFGPSVDRFWPKPRLGGDFGSNVAGLYVIGDATGQSRGIVQAVASGLMWASTMKNSLSLSSGSRESALQDYLVKIGQLVA